MEEDIRIFLDSPGSLELASEVDMVKACRSQKKKKKKERLPRYVPFQNVYAQTDFSKLTERQRILALKFQTSRLQANSLFLAVNNLIVPDKSKLGNGSLDCKRCFPDAFKLLKFLEWLAARHGCPRHAKILELRSRLELLMGERSCICRREKKVYAEAAEMADYSCCMDQLF